MAYQRDRQRLLPAPNFLVHGMAVRNESSPTVFATQVAVLIRVFPMTTMVVAINDYAAHCGRFRKACVAS